MSDLLPCPFCGSTSIDPKFWSSDAAGDGPGCNECGATAETKRAWNTRTEAVTVRAAEREECAKVADSFSTKENDDGHLIAAAIRARGQK